MHCGGALLSSELSQRTALGILIPPCPGAPTPKGSGARFSGITASGGIQLWPERRPGAPGAWETRGDSHSSLDPASPEMGTGPRRDGAGTRCAAGAQRRQGTLVYARRGRLAGGAKLCRLGGSRPGPGPWRCPSSSWPAWPGAAPGRGSWSSAPTARFSASISSASSFLRPATRAFITGSDWPGCHAKKRGVCGGGVGWGGGNTGNNFPRRRRKRRWSPEEGAGSFPPCGRRRGAARRGQRVEAPAAARSGTDCPILPQGPGPGPRINSRRAGPELQGTGRPRSPLHYLPGPPGQRVLCCAPESR